uniref:Uncharacterized protein n=1 Tax=Thermosporothrix sp. COM3 TaxID=2490863 RepID=A0A455SDK1_9CHLR|nr:hypothetical protein KTC_12740 [Thermosporothrix sp. COM3]
MVLRALFHLILADFRERMRRYSFFVMLVLSMLAAYFYLPPQSSPYQTLNLGMFRGMYNSAWVGMQIALVASLWLPIVGFYLVKNGIERDQQTRVGQIIASTPLHTFVYILGKMLSNVAVLASMVGATAIVAGGTQFLRAEDMRLDLWALLSPFLFLTLPAIFIPAALAVFFEMVSWLRGSLGNVVYFFISIVLAFLGQRSTGARVEMLDPFGISVPLKQVHAFLLRSFPHFTGETSLGLTFNDPGRLQVFMWQGIEWTGDILLQRLLWIGIACALALIASLFFSRFDPARASNKRHIMEKLPEHGSNQIRIPVSVPLTPLLHGTTRGRWLKVLQGELVLLLKGRSMWWYGALVLLNVIMLAVPSGLSQYMLYPLATIWPLFLWSSLGSLETRCGTQQTVFAVPHPLLRHLPMQWLAGVLCTLLMLAGLVIRLGIEGSTGKLMAICLVVLFIPSLAMAFGIWVGNGRLFEVLYLAWWYIGPVNHLPGLDYLAPLSMGMQLQLASILLGGLLLLLILIFIGRKRQLLL